VLLSICSGLGALVFLIKIADWKSLLTIYKALSWSMLLVALFCYGTTWIFRVGRFRLFLESGGQDISAPGIFAVLISGFGLNAFLPGKAGEVATIIFLRWKGIAGSTALAAVIQARILDLLALLTLMSTAGLPTALQLSAAPYSRAVLAGAGLLTIAPMLFMALDRRQNLERFIEKMYRKPLLSATAKTLHKFLVAYRRICLNGRLLAATGLFSLFIWTGEGMVAWFITKAAAVPASLSVCLLAVSLGNLGKAIPLTPGGVGVYEAIMAAVLHGTGLDWGSAVAVALADHLLKKTCSIGIGLPLAVHLVGDRGWSWLTWKEEKT